MYINTREVVSALIPKYVRGKTLDVGGGTSKYREIIKQTVSDYVVSDLFDEPGVDVITDARAMSFANESFDSVISFQVLEHVDNTTAVVSEIYRVLKKDGVAVVTAPFLCAEHGHPSDYHRFTEEGMKFYFERAGFLIIESGKQGSTFSVIKELLRFVLLNPYKKNGRMRKGIFNRLAKMLVSLDRKGYLYNPDLYTNVYVVAQKLHA